MTNEYVELEQNGNWYTIEIADAGCFDVFKVNGKEKLNELIDDLIHDCKLDELYNLIPQLEGMRK